MVVRARIAVPDTRGTRTPPAGRVRVESGVPKGYGGMRVGSRWVAEIARERVLGVLCNLLAAFQMAPRSPNFKFRPLSRIYVPTNFESSMLPAL